MRSEDQIKIGWKFKCKRCGLIYTMSKHDKLLLRENPRLWTGKIYCEYCGSECERVRRGR